MKPVWFILWAMVVGQIALWAFAPDKPDAQPAPTDPGRPYGDTEQHAVKSRVSQRKGAMAASICPGAAAAARRARLHRGINEYYYRRQNQYERYPEIHGKLGADYIATQWSTGEDKRIERLTQEAYAAAI